MRRRSTPSAPPEACSQTTILRFPSTIRLNGTPPFASIRRSCFSRKRSELPPQQGARENFWNLVREPRKGHYNQDVPGWRNRSEEHTSELQSLRHLVCRLLL